MSDEIMNVLTRNGYFSVSEFARAMGEDRNNVNKNLKGIKKLTVPKLLKFAKYLNISIEDAMWLFYPNEMKEFVAQRNRKEIYESIQNGSQVK